MDSIAPRGYDFTLNDIVLPLVRTYVLSSDYEKVMYSSLVLE